MPASRFFIFRLAVIGRIGMNCLIAPNPSQRELDQLGDSLKKMRP
jgi:hypothetical protein